MEFTSSSLIALLITFAFLDWIYIAWSNKEIAGQSISRILLITLGIGAVGSLFNIIPTENDILPDVLPQPELALYLASLLLIAFGVLSFHYLQWQTAIRQWLIATGLWLVVSMVLGIIDTETKLGSENWLGDITNNAQPASLLILIGWTVIGIVLLALAFYKFYKAGLPEVANRALIWAVITPLVSMGTLLAVSGSEVLREAGWVIQVVGFGLVTYSVISFRGLDIRRAIRFIAANMLLVALTALFMMAMLYAADEIKTSDVDNAVFIVGFGIASAVLFTPLFFVAQGVVNRLLRPSLDDITPEIRRFAEAITGVVELDQLANVVMETLRDVLGVRRGALLMVETHDNKSLRIIPHEPTMGEVPDTPGFIVIDGLIYKTFYTDRKPLLQFDLDFAPDYAQANIHEKAFFKHLHMAAYAPIVVQGKLVGLLACGPKSNDDRFFATDLELLSTIANQTGIALRNARLVEDVLRRERDIAESNKRLEVAKRQLEALDSVKTDFITIASHELRTPLAQIRGHTDIISALNEQGMLDQEQLSSLTNNLRRAADRLEGLIGDMLDVSQLDLSAMDLRFAQTTIESAVRLAVEPLQESIRNRKQSLTARGLRGLSPLEADMQRLVQAIRNIVLNAVKYTPDGGRIDIIGTLVKNERTGEDEIQITIKDTGIGIDPKNREAIFEKFFRASDPGLHSTGATKFMGAGPGLGLTIAKGVIEGHGGRIWVESSGFDPDNLPGSTFYILLPITPPEGARRVMSISSSGLTSRKVATGTHAIVAKPDGTKVVAPPATPEPKETKPESPTEESEEGPFVEANPTLLNPSAHRAGLTAALLAAAEKAKSESDDEDKASPEKE